MEGENPNPLPSKCDQCESNGNHGARASFCQIVGVCVCLCVLFKGLSSELQSINKSNTLVSKLPWKKYWFAFNLIECIQTADVAGEQCNSVGIGSISECNVHMSRGAGPKGLPVVRLPAVTRLLAGTTHIFLSLSLRQFFLHLTKIPVCNWQKGTVTAR